MKKTQFYARPLLDRVSHLRKNDPWIADRLDHGASNFIPVWREKSLVTGSIESGDVRGVFLSRDQAKPFINEETVWVYLGEDDSETAWFGVDVSTLSRPEATALGYEASAEGARFEALWGLGTLLPAAEASRLAFAKAMVYWHLQHRFCGRCGAPTISKVAGHVRQCNDTDCGKESFPRTDPAVIMLVTGEVDGEDALLLGRQAVWPKGMFSVLAGFVEPGESLEEAVVREVFEEAGVRVEAEDVDYRASQPWPFPSSIMIGMRARASDQSLTVNKEEMDDARWFTRSEIENRKKTGLYLPRPVSVGRALIDEWLAQG